MSLALLDWRRRVAELYGNVRTSADPAEAHAAWREGRDELLRSHPESPVRQEERSSFPGARYGSYDPAMRFEAEVDVDVSPVVIDIATGTDGIVSFRRFGRVDLGELGGLDVWWLLGYGGGVFVPFADPHPETYSGGRYVLDTVKGADLGGSVDLATGRGRLVVDLNFAFNPSCAYDPAWACPLAPPGNRLLGPVGAGERIPPP